MQRVKAENGRHFRTWSTACIGAALLCLLSAPTQAQPRGQTLANFQPTMADVPPGVDHGNADDNLPETFQRQAVFYRSQLPVGTIVIDTAERHLYLIESETRALRYGIGVGREGLATFGLWSVSRKQEWPEWKPSLDVLAQEPNLPRAVPGGPGNPLGARAMTLGNSARRLIHGTNAPETIGQALLIGCFRLVNEDVIDLYDRVNIGTRVIVRQN
jgi:lipoprotein-anchoring transpeptidase ErfK/SrfK